MTNLHYRQEKIQEKRKQTIFRDFVREIASWMPVNFYKINGVVSRFPDTGRQGNIVSIKDYMNHIVKELEISTSNFLSLFVQLFVHSDKMIVQQRFENENSVYAECHGAKNTYLSFWIGQNAENVLYSAMSHTSIRNVINSFVVVGNCDNIYTSRCITNSYNVFYSSNIHNSSNIFFSTNLLWCSECLLCDGLENQSYCIGNTQYTKDEYMLLKMQTLQDKDWYELLHQQVLCKDIESKLSTNVVGKGVVKSHNITDGYFVQWITNGKNIFQGGWEYGGHNFYDCFDVGNQKDEYIYAANYVWETSSHVYCVVWWANLHNCYYGYHLESCSFCLWCIGLKNKSYCILNKQYSKDERYAKVNEIFAQMERDWQLWEFFPASMNPFYFNDTAAYLIDPSFTKEEVTKLWYLRRDEPITVDIPEGAVTVKSSELGQFESVDERGERKLDETVCKRVIIDENGDAYRIIPMELEFLQKHGLPLPRKHWLTRMKENFRIR